MKAERALLPAFAAVTTAVLVAGAALPGATASSPSGGARVNSGALQTSDAPYIGNTGECCGQWRNTTVSFSEIAANGTAWSEEMVKRPGDAGNVAVGAWWSSFPGGAMYPLSGTSIWASVNVAITTAHVTQGRWARIALATAIYVPSTNCTLYTELDVWDSPQTYPAGDTSALVHAGPGVVEYKYAQLAVGVPTRLEVDLTPYITAWWGSTADHALLESVYVVIEAGIGTSGTMAARVAGLTLDAVHGDGWTGGGM